MRQKQGVFSLFLLSPSSRRAWIEIYSPAGHWMRLVLPVFDSLTVCRRFSSQLRSSRTSEMRSPVCIHSLTTKAFVGISAANTWAIWAPFA